MYCYLELNLMLFRYHTVFYLVAYELMNLSLRYNSVSFLVFLFTIVYDAMLLCCAMFYLVAYKLMKFTSKKRKKLKNNGKKLNSVKKEIKTIPKKTQTP